MKPLFTKPKKKPHELLKLKRIKSREIFLFKPPIPIESSYVIGLTSLEVYNSIFNINTKNNKFELYTDTFDEFHLRNQKKNLKKALVFQILHHIISNMKK